MPIKYADFSTTGYRIISSEKEEGLGGVGGFLVGGDRIWFFLGKACLE